MANKKGRSYAKSETKSKRGRYVTMAQRFKQVTNKDRRVKLPGRLVILSRDLEIIEKFAESNSISRSAAFEYIVWQWHAKGLYRHLALMDREFNIRLKSPRGVIAMPRFTLHPCTIHTLREYAKCKGVSFSVAIHRFVSTYSRISF